MGNHGIITYSTVFIAFHDGEKGGLFSDFEFRTSLRSITNTPLYSSHEPIVEIMSLPS